jgi:hypothetical protein
VRFPLYSLTHVHSLLSSFQRLLPATSLELVQRITDDSLDGSDAAQLADSMRAFDKLEHTHAAAGASFSLCCMALPGLFTTATAYLLW